MKKRKSTLLKYLIEFLLVAFGVFLGVFVSERNAQKKIDKNTEVSLTFIIDEMGANIEKMESTLEYQRNLFPALIVPLRVLKERIWNRFTILIRSLGSITYRIGEG